MKCFEVNADTSEAERRSYGTEGAGQVAGMSRAWHHAARLAARCARYQGRYLQEMGKSVMMMAMLASESEG